MMANYWPHLLAMLVGGALTVQVGMNATLARVIGSPLWASAINFAIGLLALVGFAVVAGSRASAGSFGQVPTWAWIGGLLGAAYVASVTILGPRLGGMTLVALVLTGMLPWTQLNTAEPLATAFSARGMNWTAGIIALGAVILATSYL